MHPYEYSRNGLLELTSIDSVIKDIKSSPYIAVRADEAISRTIIDLIMIDRLRNLQDKDAYHQLHVSAEVAMSVRVQDQFGSHQIIKGRADWALGYGPKSDIATSLVIIEAKRHAEGTIGVPQLLVYMAAVQDARKHRPNKSVFGILSDSNRFTFLLLDQHAKLFKSRVFEWSFDAPTIINHIDIILIDAIESSPHTTPSKKNNKTISNYPRYLSERWILGDQAADQEDKTEEDMVDIVKRGGRVAMVTTRTHETDICL